MKNKKVGIIGCGMIFPRHLEAVEANEEYELVAICDTDQQALDQKRNRLSVSSFTDYKQMVLQTGVDFIVIATPNSQHYEQAIFCLQNGCDVLIEKPATLNPKQIDDLVSYAESCQQNVYAVLQVRLNSCIQNLKYLLDNNLVGNVRGFSLVQRWQRPKEYFYDWRGQPKVGGGILHECGIHYLDILCYLLGKPSVAAAKKYNTKHKTVDIEDTVYAMLDFGDYGGNAEVTISCEPKNLECSLSLMTDSGFIKLGGKAMNVFEELNFLDPAQQETIEKLVATNNSVGTPNSYGGYAGSCPNHPVLYSRLEEFNLIETKNVLELIDEIYEACGVKYY